jgi:hypothetical protein
MAFDAHKALACRGSNRFSIFFGEVRDGGDSVGSWWWNGISRTLGLAAMIGAPYDKLWPDFVAASKSASPSLFFIEKLKSENRF